MDRFSLINISTYQFLISIFVYIHCMFIKRISEVVSVRVIQRLRCSTLSNEFLIERELISKYRKYDFHASTYVHVHAQEIQFGTDY